MTREEKIKILATAQERAYEEIDRTSGPEMGSEEFVRLLGVAHQLEWMQHPEETIPCDPTPEEDFAPDQVQPEAPKPEIVPEQVQSEPEPVKPEPETPQYELTEVRAALAKARANGVNVSEIVRSFGAESFPQIDKSQYGAVMAKLEEALNAT